MAYLYKVMTLVKNKGEAKDLTILVWLNSILMIGVSFMLEKDVPALWVMEFLFWVIVFPGILSSLYSFAKWFQRK